MTMNFSLVNLVFANYFQYFLGLNLNLNKNLFSVFIILVFFGCFPLASFASEDKFFKSPDVWNDQLSTVKVKIISSEYIFDIPRNYILHGGISNGYSSFDLAVNFPEFSGITSNNFHDFSASYDEKLKYTIFGPSEKTPNIIIIYKSDSYRKDVVDLALKLANEFGESSKIHGLIRIEKQKRKNFLSGVNDDYFYVAKNGDHVEVINCDDFNGNKDFEKFESGNVLNKNAVCRVSGILENDLKYSYDFNFYILPRWQEIDSGVRNLLNSLLER